MKPNSLSCCNHLVISILNMQKIQILIHKWARFFLNKKSITTNYAWDLNVFYVSSIEITTALTIFDRNIIDFDMLQF